MRGWGKIGVIVPWCLAMNEERIAAYLNLIQELLACPSGEENQILNQSSELLDEGFVMVVLAKSLQATIEGEDHPARFLKSLAEQVAEYIGMELPEIENPQGLGHLMQNAPVLETLQQFIQADTWSKSQEYLAQYPELLGDDVDALLSQLMEMVTEQERSVLQEHRDLLQRCREIGIEQGFEEKRANVRAARMQSAQAELPPELMELVEDPQMRELLENPQMMGLVQDIFGALQESNIAPDDLEISVRVRPELMGRVAEMAMGGTGLGNLLNAENSGDALTQFWKQLLQAEMQSGGDAAAVHQVMRPYMGLIVPALGDVIAQSMPGLLAQYPDQAEGVAGLVEDTCTSIRQFPYGRYAEALEIAIRGYDVVLALGVYSPQGRAQTLNNLGVARSTQAEMGIEPAENLQKAITAYNQAAEILRQPGLEKDLSSTLNNLGNARLTQAERGIEPAENLQKAITAYNQAAEILRQLGLARNLATTLNNFSFAYQAQSRLPSNSPDEKQAALDNAYRSFQEALDRVEYLRGEIGANSEGYKRNFNEEWNKVYRGMVEVCLELGRYQDAIEYADRSKARNLVELMATRDAYPGGVIPDDIRQQLQELRQTIAAEDYRLQKEKNPDRTHLDQLRQEFQKKFPYKPLHFQAMQELLDEETAILEWYILEDKFLTFTLTREKLYLWTSSQEDRQKLIGWTVAYLTDYRNRNNSQWRETLAQRLEELPKILHLDEILQNLFKNFPKCQKLILIPHLYLHLFPLHALPVHLPSSPNPLLPEGEKGANSPSSPLSPLGRGAGGEGKFLQDLFPKGVTYAPNCQLLQQAQSRPRFNFNQLFAIQNPTNDIKWADTQVETIRKFFPQRKTLGTKATKANFLAQDLSQTHHLFFSCHGSFKPNSLLNSGLILADGVLSLENIIAKLNLKECSLVTLSACETGQVALDQTDEYISIASGFLLAGSPRVLMSLWSVDEASTALLLIKTYELLQKQPGKLAQALPAAQKWLRETTNSGFYAWVQKSPLLDDHWRKHLAQVFQIEQNKEGADFRPYESPYHWAAFCVVGQGEQKMARDRDKIEAFEVLLGEDLDYLLAPYRQALDELQLGDDDEQNAQAIETWLATREPLYQEYQKQLATLTAANPLLGPTTEMGIGGSKANTKGSTLEELLSNIKKRNTPPPPPEKS